MKLTKSFKRSTVYHPFTRPVGIPDANANTNANSNFFIRRQCEARCNKSLKSLEVTNNACAHSNRPRRQNDIIHETAMVTPLLPSGIAINRAQQIDRSFIETQPAAPKSTIISTGRTDTRRPKWRRLCGATLTSRRDIHKIGECIFSKYLNAPRLIVANARRPTGILKNALDLRPCRTARAEGPDGPPRGYGVQNMHYAAFTVSAGQLVGP